MTRWWPGAAGLALLATGLGGCASGNAPAARPVAGPPPVIASSPAGADIRYDPGVLTADASIEAGADAVWEALGKVWAELELPVAAADPGQHALQSGRFRAPRRIGGERLSALLDCGSTLTGRRTENSDVFMELHAAVRSAGANAARLATTIVASARNRDGTSTAAVPCASTGALEKLVAARVRERIG